MKLRRKRIEMMLSRLEYRAGSAMLEQYPTPPAVAADILFHAYKRGDIVNKSVVEFCCGCAPFAIGAAMLGAAEVHGYDVDPGMIECAAENARKTDVTVEFHVMDVLECREHFDVCFQNPPFGSQYSMRNMDVRILRKAIECADVVYTLHNAKTMPYLDALIAEMGVKLDVKKTYKFEIRHMYEFHRKERVWVEVVMYRLEV